MYLLKHDIVICYNFVAQKADFIYEKSFNGTASAWQFVGVIATGAENGKERTESVEEDSWTFLLTTVGVLNLDLLGGEASYLLFILIGVSQLNVFEC